MIGRDQGWRMELADCEATLLAEIAMPEMKRLDIAKTYALALRSSERDQVNWHKVNKAIVDRWSFSALNYIKNLAWSGTCFVIKRPPAIV